MSTLRERIEAVRAQAEAAGGTEWDTPYADACEVMAGEYTVVTGSCNTAEQATFIAAHDPAKVIRDCDADLALLDWAEARSVKVGRVTSSGAAFTLARMRIQDNLNARYPEAFPETATQ